MARRCSPPDPKGRRTRPALVSSNSSPAPPASRLTQRVNTQSRSSTSFAWQILPCFRQQRRRRGHGDGGLRRVHAGKQSKRRAMLSSCPDVEMAVYVAEGLLAPLLRHRCTRRGVALRMLRIWKLSACRPRDPAAARAQCARGSLADHHAHGRPETGARGREAVPVSRAAVRPPALFGCALRLRRPRRGEHRWSPQFRSGVSRRLRGRRQVARNLWSQVAALQPLTPR